MKRSILLAIVGMACATVGTVLAGELPICAECHDEVAAGMKNQIHMRIQPFEVYGREVGCVGCHGTGEAHMKDGDASLITTFGDDSPAATQVCVDCHGSKNQPQWAASTHAIEGLTCTDCHTIHTRSNPLDSCKTCHQDVYAEFELPSHHPVREGKMSCLDCHDPHAATEMQLKSDTRINDVCYSCHQSKEGPFIFEHEPVVEDCRLCHRAHGAVAEQLLTATEPMLCYQCHEVHFHAGLVSPDETVVEVGGREFENPYGEHGMNIAFTTRCSQCHSQIHGSDLPTQTISGAGNGLVR